MAVEGAIVSVIEWLQGEVLQLLTISGRLWYKLLPLMMAQ